MNPLERILADEADVIDLEEFAKQIVGETILAVLATNHTQAVYTTFDQQLMDGAVARVVDQIRNHWNFK